MKNAVSHVYEMILGALLFILGMWFLVSNEKVIDRMTDIVNDKVIETQDLYQQTNDVNINMISDDELYAIVIGYREYPITIDGTLIEVDGFDYENYVTLIKEGIYIRSYVFNSVHNIIRVNYTYSGM